MIIIGAILIAILLYFFIPRGTIAHEIMRLPDYNYRAQTTRRNDMAMEKHSFGPHRKQYLYFYYPNTGAVRQDQVIIYYHGGGWTLGSPIMFRCNAQFFVDRGYAVIMPAYRQLPFNGITEMQEDAGLALKKSIEILEEKGLGSKSLILSGMSSGGHLAALTAFNRNIWRQHRISRNKLAGAMLFAPPLDLYKMAKTPVIWMLAGSRNSDSFNQANPVYHIREDDNLPILLLHGTKDGLVNYKSSLSFIKKLRTKNITFHTIENGTHMESGFWNFEDNESRKVLVGWLEKLNKTAGVTLSQ